MKKSFAHINILICILIFATQVLHAQKIDTHDTSYYKTYPNKLTGRIFLSEKLSSFVIPASDNYKDITYVPNSKLSLGVGATYKNMTLNVGAGFGFLNNSRAERGETKSLDFQIHAYRPTSVVDITAISHKGMHIQQKGLGAYKPDEYYYRPEVNQLQFGLSYYHIANHDKFSYRAAMIQNEWQQKSAGSVLYGGQAYYAKTSGDSPLVPLLSRDGFEQADFSDVSFFNVSAGLGYAYTLVIQKHFYVTGSLIGNVGVNFVTEATSSEKQHKTGINPSGIYKGAAGYNSENWNLSASIAGNAFLINTSTTAQPYVLQASNLRFNIARRFDLKKK